MKNSALYSLTFILLIYAPNLKAQHPFKYDSLYPSIYATELCSLLSQKNDLLLVDVRTPGEYSDTSHYASLNQGHLKDAINIDVETITKNPDTILAYKDKTLVFYCSHSQRSRRVSKLLTEKGFSNFCNLNGGMSSLNQLQNNFFPCKKELVTTALPYSNLSFEETAELISTVKDLIILDIRTVQQYTFKDTAIENNIGRFKGAINIPYSEFQQRKSELFKFKNRPILIYSVAGDGDGGRAAASLVLDGFQNVYHLLGGIDNFIASRHDLSLIEGSPKFFLINPKRTLDLLLNSKSITIYDSRSADEYNNKLTEMLSYKNLGHMKNAIHVSGLEYNQIKLPVKKDEPVLVYGNSSGFRLADFLTDKGYVNVYYLDNYYDFVWSAFNIEECRGAKKYLVDHDGIF